MSLTGDKMTQVMPHPPHSVGDITQATLNSLNIEQAKADNLANLIALGGIEGLASKLGVDLENGLRTHQVQIMSSAFGSNAFPSSPQKYFIVLFFEALQDPVLLVLIGAACISLIVETIQHPEAGWIDAVAIFIAIILVATITSVNDYSKELQFRALEKSSQQDEFSTVVRDGETKRVRAYDLVVGDILILQTGDMIPADSIVTDFSKAMCNEASLTGEPEDRKKSKDHDPFLLSSTLVSECDGDVRAMVTGIGLNSQWGKIKSNLVVEDVNTPLQDKLETMTQLIGYVGMGFAFATFIALVAQIFVQGLPIGSGFINAFILSVVIIVVAIPEGLPLAVAIALAYSTKKMYGEKCFIRILAACETMGNTTNICSDKTGTLTENRMTIVAGWFGDKAVFESDFPTCHYTLTTKAKEVIAQNAAINRTAYYVVSTPNDLPTPTSARRHTSDGATTAGGLTTGKTVTAGTGTGTGTGAGAVYQVEGIESQQFEAAVAPTDSVSAFQQFESARSAALVTPSNQLNNKRPMDLTVDPLLTTVSPRMPMVKESSERLLGPKKQQNSNHHPRPSQVPSTGLVATSASTTAEPNIIGNKTEASLMTMIRKWGNDPDTMKHASFNPRVDKIFPFDSKKKRSTAVIHLPSGGIRLLCKGAAEWVLKDCTKFLDAEGHEKPLDEAKLAELTAVINTMANQALRTLVLAHLDFPSESALPKNWDKHPPDDSNLCVDCIVGIIDPIRSDVREAVQTAQRAGVVVRMVTGDNLATARAIAKQCGILDESNSQICIEGPSFRTMTPSELDSILKGLRVLARSSPDDKRLLVSRLNGHTIPETEDDWKEMHKGNPTANWATDRDKLLPGYKEEWVKTRPRGGEVVGVTGDGTNDAPALKAADVGLSMGITGTKVAQEASDIVILDDKFSSIINAIKWGRGVYDNIRKFLQFQLTVNVAALILVFVGAVAGFGEPLNPIQMLWVNLVMDTLGALALATEIPTIEVLNRKPYKRSALIVSRPMYRNIIVMAIFQLVLAFLILFNPKWFNVLKNGTCIGWEAITGNSNVWDVTTGQTTSNPITSADPYVNCQSFATKCSQLNYECYTATQTLSYNGGQTATFKFENLNSFSEKCFGTCSTYDWQHGTLIFNTFIFCQLFNEYVSRTVDDWNFMRNIGASHMFLIVSVVSVGLQVIMVEFGGAFVKTSPLTLSQWGITIGLGAITWPLGILMKLIPVAEDPRSFFDSEEDPDDGLIGKLAVFASDKA